ncbi:MAG: aldo/keto reductase, partial [Lachnospiraceae bacterium]|nr:aldo/keto reductase [Lachnospiraceae bacterium]
TEYIDLYYQHRIDPNIPPEEVAGVMSELMKEGKILHWGISETDENYFRHAHAVCPVAAIQNRYSMMARWHESLFPVLEELNVGYVAFSPLANGFLTAAYQNEVFTDKDDYRRNMPQYTEKGYEENAPVIALVRRYAEEKNATPAQISLAWMLCKKPYIVPIPGSRKINRLRENADADTIKLLPEEVMEIDKALDQMELSVYGGASYKVQEGEEK